MSKITCENECKNDNKNIFKISYQDGAIEYFCSECTSNIIREVPELIISIKIWGSKY